MLTKLCVSSLALLALIRVGAAAEMEEGPTSVSAYDETRVAVIHDYMMKGGGKGAMKKKLIECMHKAGISQEDIDTMNDVRYENFVIYLGSSPRTVSPEVALKALHAALRCFSRRKDNTQCCSERYVSDKCKVFCDGRSPAKYESMGLEELMSECSGEGRGYIDTVLECHIDRYKGAITDGPKVRPTAGVTPTAKVY